MLEIPEAATIARQLAEKVVGKEVETVIAAQSPHGFGWYFGDPAEYADKLCGKGLTGAWANAGQVEIAFGELRLVINDGVNMRYVRSEQDLPKKHQLYIGFAEGDGLVCTVQMYGGMMLFRDGEYDSPYYLVCKEKPSPLTEAFDERYFRGIIDATPVKQSVKALLATEQRIPGLGNGCLQDILFKACINPQTKLSLLGDGEIAQLYKCLKETLAEMTEGGGRDTEKDLFGNPGGYRSILSNKTYAYACPVCGGGIARKAYMGGNVYFCPVCQPLRK